MGIVVSDTSPLRALSHLGLLELLPDLFGEVMVSPAVVREAASAGVVIPDEPAFKRVSPTNARLVSRLGSGLDPGEAEAIALAVEVDADILLIDELKGRAVAKSLGLSTKGVLGILLAAKLAGRVPAIGPLIVRLKTELNFFLSAGIIAEALKLADESGEIVP